MQSNTATHGYVIGGTGAVSAAVEAELDAAFIDFSRIGGANRYDTAAKLATKAFEGMGMLWSRPALATGLDFPDALAGGVLQGSDYSVLLLTRGTTLAPEAAAALTANRKMIYELRYLGGDGVLSPGVRSAARALVPGVLMRDAGPTVAPAYGAVTSRAPAPLGRIGACTPPGTVWGVPLWARTVCSTAELYKPHGLEIHTENNASNTSCRSCTRFWARAQHAGCPVGLACPVRCRAQ